MTNKSNPFDKYFTAEDNLHINVVRYVKMQYSGALISHSPNEGKRTPFERYKASKLGVSSGFPDLQIIYNGRQLFLELKTEANKVTGQKAGKPSINQLAWIEGLQKQGFNAAIAYGFDNAKTIIDTVFKASKAA